MSKLRVQSFSVSIDGFGAGLHRDLANPLGVGGMAATGDNPPYHTPVFVLTNHPRPSITMGGGAVFHFVADGMNAALTRATEAAQGQDVRLEGGVATARHYLRAALIDEMHLAISPVLLGSREHLLSGIGARLSVHFGGPGEIRTHDLFHAMEDISSTRSDFSPKQGAVWMAVDAKRCSGPP
jgi:hypothetical protein